MIGFFKNAIIIGGGMMGKDSVLSKEEISNYLREVKEAINSGKYSFSNREKNKKLFLDYIINEKERIQIIRDLDIDDFCGIRNNNYKDYLEEKLYVFSKKVKLIKRFEPGEENVELYIKFNKLDNGFCFVISFHELEYPIKKYFK